MGIVYDLAWRIPVRHTEDFEQGPELAEMIWGCYLWACIVTTIGLNSYRQKRQEFPRQQGLWQGEAESKFEYLGRILMMMTMAVISLIFFFSAVQYSQVKQKDMRNWRETQIGLTIAFFAFTVPQAVLLYLTWYKTSYAPRWRAETQKLLVSGDKDAFSYSRLFPRLHAFYRYTWFICCYDPAPRNSSNAVPVTDEDVDRRLAAVVQVSRDEEEDVLHAPAGREAAAASKKSNSATSNRNRPRRRRHPSSRRTHSHSTQQASVGGPSQFGDNSGGESGGEASGTDSHGSINESPRHTGSHPNSSRAQVNPNDDMYSLDPVSAHIYAVDGVRIVDECEEFTWRSLKECIVPQVVLPAANWVSPILLYKYIVSLLSISLPMLMIYLMPIIMFNLIAHRMQQDNWMCTDTAHHTC